MIQRKKYWILLSLSLSLMSVKAYADVAQTSLPFSLVASFTGGVGFLNANSQQITTSAAEGGQLFSYQDNGALKKPAILGGFIGIEYPFSNHSIWAVQIGLAYSTLFPYSVNGNNAVGNTAADITNYAYDYQVRSQQAFVESKLLATFAKRYHPYLLLDLGSAINNTFDYQATTNTNVDHNATFLFNNHQNVNFSYGVGIGLDTDINPHFRLGLGYRFVDLGTVATGTGQLQLPEQSIPTSYSLSQNHLLVQELVAQLTYLF